MCIPTPHRGTGAQWQQDSGHVRVQQHDYACATVRARRLPSPDGTPNTTEEQTSPQAQTSASPDARLALGYHLRLARAWPQLHAPTRIPRTTTPSTVAHVRRSSTIALGRLPPHPSWALASISVAKDTQHHPA
jgi:hypothetical protein